ncbi:MAG: methionyl-tRNA formyltransferase [Phycisphaerales bacterium]
MANPDQPLRLVLFGSGAFGLPTFEQLRSNAERCEVSLVVTQPDRPAGRKREPRPTPVGEWAASHDLPLLKPESVNDPPTRDQIRAAEADAFVVIAFGQKLGPELLDGVFAINLHGSLLPKYRGAAPIQRAVMAGERQIGVSVIGLAERMDAGAVYAMAMTTVGAEETSGDLHDRLAELGPRVIERVLEQFRGDTLDPTPQNDAEATLARKMTKEEGTTHFDKPCDAVRARINGLNPWPGCSVTVEGRALKIGRVRSRPEIEHGGSPGAYLGEGLVACGAGAVELLEMQAPGGRMMRFEEFERGHSISTDARFAPTGADTKSK